MTRAGPHMFTKRCRRCSPRQPDRGCEPHECDLVHFDGGPDHLRLSVKLTAKPARSKLVTGLEDSLSKPMRQELPELAGHIWRARRSAPPCSISWEGQFRPRPLHYVE